MSNRRRSGNASEVRGSISALTSFLKEKNIHIANANRYRRRQEEDATNPNPLGLSSLQLAQQQQQQQQQQAESSSSASAIAPASASLHSPSPSAVGETGKNAKDYPARPVPRRQKSSMNFEEEEDSEEDAILPPAKKSKNENGQTQVASTSQQPTMSTPMLAATNPSRKHTAPGSIDFCPMCTGKFTVTKYTKQTPHGGLCHKCGPKYKEGPLSALPSGPVESSLAASPESPSAPAKRRPAVRRQTRQVPIYDVFQLPSLQSLCIGIVSKHIHNVEALLGVGGQNMDAISKSISKARSLDDHTMKLFLQPDARSIRFYDCSKLTSTTLQLIPKVIPQLQEINLQLCGQLDNDAIDAWSTRLPDLKRVELFGPFLVRKEAWHRFFERIGHGLTSFKIRESPRFDLGCCKKMVEHCPNLTEIGLAQIGPLNGECLNTLHSYKDQLTYLDVSDPGVSAPGVPPKSLEDDDVVELLKNVGSNLKTLNLSRNEDLTERTIIEGIIPNCPSLEELHLALFDSYYEEGEGQGQGDVWGEVGDLAAGGENGEEATAEPQEETEDPTSPAAPDGEGEEEKTKLPPGKLGFLRLFERTKPGLLHTLSLERCLRVDDEVIKALVEHSGKTLVYLSLNSCRLITAKGFDLIAEHCPQLRHLDVSFCRAVDDGVMINLIAKLEKLERVDVFACFRISDYLDSKKVRIVGKEKYRKA